jgi:hypothetical protein
MAPLNPLQPSAAARALLALLTLCGMSVAPRARADEVTDQPAADVGPAPREARPSPLAFVLAGGGVTSRTLELPAPDGPRSLATGLAPALSIRLAGRVQNSSRFLGWRLSYQSSVGLHATNTVPDVSLTPSETHIRSHRFEAGVAPGLFLSRSPDSVALSLFAGYGLRALASVAELRIPRFTLHGPVARLELDVPLFAGRLSVRLAPDVQWLVGMTHQLRTLSGIDGAAIALGGEASMRLHLIGAWAARLCYREAHVRSTGLDGRAFEDIERYLTLELSLRAH